MDNTILQLQEQYALTPKRVLDVRQFFDGTLLSIISFTRTDDGWYHIVDKSDRTTIMSFHPDTGEQASMTFDGAIGTILSGGLDLYYTDTDNGTVNRWSRETGSEQVAAGISHPLGMAIDAKGLYVADFLAHEVLFFDHAGGRETVLNSIVKNPISLLQHPDGTLLVVSSGSGQLIKVDKDLGIVDVIGKLGCSDHDFNIPSSVAVTNDGRLVVSDAYNRCIKVLKNTGTHIFSIYGFLDEVMVCPQTIVAHDGYYSVCCSHSMKIFEFEL